MDELWRHQLTGEFVTHEHAIDTQLASSFAIESARGECGCYLVSDGGTKPWRVKFRAPSFAALQATATCVRDTAIADLVAVAASLDPVMGDVDR